MTENSNVNNGQNSATPSPFKHNLSNKSPFLFVLPFFLFGFFLFYVAYYISSNYRPDTPLKSDHAQEVSPAKEILVPSIAEIYSSAIEHPPVAPSIDLSHWDTPFSKDILEKEAPSMVSDSWETPSLKDFSKAFPPYVENLTAWDISYPASEDSPTLRLSTEPLSASEIQRAVQLASNPECFKIKLEEFIVFESSPISREHLSRAKKLCQTEEKLSQQEHLNSIRRKKQLEAIR